MEALDIPWHPLRFGPTYQARVWGGRTLETRYGRRLPEGPVGESWEIVDRAGTASVVAEGPLRGRTLTELMGRDPEGLLGDAVSHGGRFPLLVKILDAREVLSLQVHPPSAVAGRLGGEPKSELWYFTGAEDGAEILVGLRRGVSRSEFEERAGNGTVAECFHRIPVRSGDAMYLPSGRVHALGKGLLLIEIQENSDTTYRVYDWNRPGLDGRPRELHLRESLESIDFSDHEPGLIGEPWLEHPAGGRVRDLVPGPEFRAWARSAEAGIATRESLERCRVIGMIRGRMRLEGGAGGVELGEGDVCLVPAGARELRTRCLADGEWVCAEPRRRG